MYLLPYLQEETWGYAELTRAGQPTASRVSSQPLLTRAIDTWCLGFASSTVLLTKYTGALLRVLD